MENVGPISKSVDSLTSSWFFSNTSYFCVCRSIFKDGKGSEIDVEKWLLNRKGELDDILAGKVNPFLNV